MADETGIPSVYLEHQLSHEHKGKKKIAPLIDKLRHRVSQSRSWMSSINSVRTAVAERRTHDVPDVSTVQSCLDRMQKAIKVLSVQTLKERLDLIGRQLGLNTDIQDKRISMGIDAFHIDIRLADDGSVQDVKLANQGDVVDCPDLKEILKKGDFTEFVEHLQGLQSIYQVTNDEKLKSKAFIALQSLEKDLNQLAQFQSSISGVANYIHKCPLGVMLPRMAGKPMKLIYFVSPYDLLDKKSLKAHPLTVEAITDNFLGQSVTVCIEPVGESSPSNKLQTMPLMNVSKTADGKSLPSFSSWSPMNSTMLPASFVLVLPQSIPVSTHIVQKITALTNLEIHKDSEVKNLQSLILESFSQSTKNSKKLLVSLPDQHHVYILNGMNGGSQDQQGVLVSRIPFTHPTHVPKILNHLRQQLLFNIIVRSCIRPDAKKETVDSIVFEVNAVSLKQLTIAFEHPAYDSLTTVDIDLSDITSLKCQVSCANPDQFICSDETISRVFQRCMSVPIMLRRLISKGRSQLGKIKEAAIAAEKERLEKALLQKEMQQRQAKMQANILPTKSRPPPQPPHPPPLPPPPSYPHQHHSSPHVSKGQTSNNGQAHHLITPMLDESRNIIPGLDEFRGMSDTNAHHGNNERILLSPEAEKAFTPSLSSSLDEDKGNGNSQSDVNDNPMLSRLLDDNMSVATTIIPMNCKPNPPPTTTKRQRKRKSQSEFSGPIHKQRMSDNSNDSVDRLSNMGCSMDMDVGVMDPTFNPAMTMGMPSMPSPHGHPAHHSMLNHSTMRSQTPGNVIDLTGDNVVGESSLKKLVDSVDSLDKQFSRKDMKTEPDLSMLLYENDATMSRIPNTVQNSPSSSKNENASTSLEGFLKGSGEVGRANNYDPVDAGNVPTSCSKLSSLLLAPTEGPQIIGGKHQPMNSTFLPDKVRNAGDGKLTPVNHTVMQDIKPQIRPPGLNVLHKSPSVDFPVSLDNNQVVPNIDKLDTSKQSANIKSESLENESGVPSGEGRVSLKFTLKQQNNVKTLTKQCNSFDETDLHLSKLDSTGTFDFKSDEEEDDNPIMPRYVYSSSPTRLQISTNKQKRPTESNLGVKVEKNKKKDKSSTTSTKRKREKEESRREKKRKKNEHIVSESVYRTVENEEKSEIPKLKIRVAKKPVSDKNDKSEFPNFTEQSYEISKKLSESPRECKVFTSQQSESITDSKIQSNKQTIEDTSVPVIDLVKEKESNNDSPVAPQKASSQKSSIKSGGSKVSSVSSVNSKTDPKLVTKATIRLKPLTMLNSGTTISISQSAPKSAGSTTAGSMKMDRRSYSSTSLSTEKRTAGQNSTLDRRSSLSGIHDRRNSSVSSSATLSVNAPVTTTAKISLSSILPNAPTVSKIASLPRIPKLSSSSNASINRTSSLDPASGTNTSQAGSKSNNSYTAGRHNAVSPSGPGPGGGRGAFGNSSSFNYNNRMAPPGAWNNRPILPFNPNRSGGTPHRQTSPLGNNSMRPSGHRQVGPHSNVNSNAQMGGKSAKVNTSNNPILKVNNGSSNCNFNTNATQKTFASGAKTINNINPHAKMSNVNSAGANTKTSQASSNTASVQRFSGSHTHSTTNSVRSQSSVTKSPNTTGINQSPNACHSPSITGSNRSPSLNSAGKSPNISGSSKSPNLNRSPSLTSSPTINRSPNINNTNRSPSVQSASNRSSNNVSSSRKSPLTVPIKTVPGASKNSPVLKTPPSTNLSMLLTSSQKFSSGQSSTNTTKPSILKNAIRSQNESTNISCSNTQQSTNVNQIHLNKVSVSVSGNVSKKQHNISVTSHQQYTQSSVTLISTVVQSSPMQVVSSTTNSVSSFSSGSKISSDGAKKCESSNTSLVSSSNPGNVQETSLSNTSSVSSGIDNKNKGTAPSSRGRKNSLSAIVDKLKNNAAGGGIDLAFSNNKPQTNVIQPDSKEASSKKSPQVDHMSSTSEVLKPSDSSHLKSPSLSSVTKSIPSGNNPSSNSGPCSKESPDQKGKDTEKHSFFVTSKTDKEMTSLSNKEDKHKNVTVEDSKSSSSESVKDMPQPSTISSPSVVSPCSNSFPLHQSPLARSTPSSPSIVPSKSNGENSQSKDRVFKVPSVKEVEERISSPDLGKTADPTNVNKWCDKSNDSQQQNSLFLVSNASVKSFPHSDKKLTKSVESPLSDISSPDNDLVIDDESPKSTAKLSSGKGSHVNVSKNNCSSPIPKSVNTLNSKLDTKGETSQTTSSIPVDKITPSSPVVSMEGVVSSPQTSSRPPSALSSKSPVCIRNQSGASTPKGSDSPFEIDDDLMDVALGCDS